jgi:hypothetical protein
MLTREADRKATDGKYLTFALCGEEYGIPILKAKETIDIPIAAPGCLVLFPTAGLPAPHE